MFELCGLARRGCDPAARTDLVALIREGHDPVIADFDRALAKVGDLMEPQETTSGYKLVLDGLEG